MSSDTGAGRPGITDAAVPDPALLDPALGGAGSTRGERFGLAPGEIPSQAASTASGQYRPPLTFTALDGLRGLAVPFVLAFALRADIATLNAPAALQYLADGGYVLVDLFLVLVGFLLCRPLTAALTRAATGAGAAGSDIATGILRRVAPLHLLAWVITFAWLVPDLTPAARSDWLYSAALLNGPFGPLDSGYPLSWSVSVAVTSVALMLLAGLGLTAVSRRTGRHPGIALLGGIIGTVLLVVGGQQAVGTIGLAAVGQGLLGLATGMLTFRVLEGATGTLTSPRPGTVPTTRPTPGLGAVLALAALLFCVYRSDLVHELDLLPIFPVAALLVYLLAVPPVLGRNPLVRFLSLAPLQWLGSRALALYLLHGPVQLTVNQVCELRGFDRGRTTVTYSVLGIVVLGSLVAAELGHRLLGGSRAPAAPAPAATTSIYRVPHSRPERIAQIDRTAIPSELRLKPLPRTAAVKRPAGPGARPAAAPAAGSLVGSGSAAGAGSAVDLAGGTAVDVTSSTTTVDLTGDATVDLTGRRPAPPSSGRPAVSPPARATGPARGRAAAPATDRAADEETDAEAVPATGTGTTPARRGATVPDSSNDRSARRTGGGKLVRSAAGKAAETAADQPTPPTGDPIRPRTKSPATRAAKPAGTNPANPRPSNSKATETAPSAPRPPAQKPAAPGSPKPGALKPAAPKPAAPRSKPAATTPDSGDGEPPAKTTRKPVRRPTPRPIELPDDQPADTTVRLPTAKPTAKSVELPADHPTSTVELPTDKPVGRATSRKAASTEADQPIDLDRPAASPGAPAADLTSDAEWSDS